MHGLLINSLLVGGPIGVNNGSDKLAEEYHFCEKSQPSKKVVPQFNAWRASKKSSAKRGQSFETMSTRRKSMHPGAVVAPAPAASRRKSMMPPLTTTTASKAAAPVAKVGDFFDICVDFECDLWKNA